MSGNPLGERRSNYDVRSLHEKMDDMLDRIERIDSLLYGQDGLLGMSHKLGVLWRVHTWILYALAAGAGSLLTAYLTHLFKSLGAHK